MARIHLLGIPIDAVTMRQALAVIHQFLASDHQNHLMTPNSEMLVESTRNARFHAVLQRSALSLPDSHGLLLAARWTRQYLPERVAGVDCVQELCVALDERHPVYLLGAGEGIAERVAEVLSERNPRLRVAGTFSGSPEHIHAPDLLRRINAAQPHLLLVAFGAPTQDLWIAEYLHEMPSVRVAMGVGGTFDFLAGKAKRAPAFMRNSGLEWLWRFVQEPSRWKRMWNAVAVFPWLIVRFGTHSPDSRSAISS